MDKENKFYVYVYLDPRKPGKHVYGSYVFDYEPFYVGKGKCDRCYHHINENKLLKDKNKLKTNKIKKIIRETGDIPIIIKYSENLLEDVSIDLEIDMIKTIGRIDLKTGCLTNLTGGGNGVLILNKKLLKIKGKKHSKWMKGRYLKEKNSMYGKHYTLEERKIFSKTAKENYKKHPELKEKISNALKKKYKNAEFIKKQKSGYTLSVRTKISKSLKQKYKNNPESHPRLGKKQTDIVKKSIRKKLEKYVYEFENIITKEKYKDTNLKNLCSTLNFSKNSYVVLCSYFSKNIKKYKQWYIHRYNKEK